MIHPQTLISLRPWKVRDQEIDENEPSHAYGTRLPLQLSPIQPPRRSPVRGHQNYLPRWEDEMFQEESAVSGEATPVGM